MDVGVAWRGQILPTGLVRVTNRPRRGAGTCPQVLLRPEVGHQLVPSMVDASTGWASRRVPEPIGVCTLLAYFFGRPNDWHAVLCTFFVGFSLTTLSTDTLKNYVGYLRPIFFLQCDPDEYYQECQNDGTSIRKSFPSGHASESFCGLLLLTLYIHTRFGVPSVLYARHAVMDGLYKPPRAYFQRLISVLSLLPMALALWIASSRIADNKHHPADVIAGACLGAALAAFSSSLWIYP